MRTLRKVVRLHPVQDEFFSSPALYRAFVGGVGSGKSFVGTFDLIHRARRDRTYMVVGPTYTSLRDSTLRSFLSVGRELGVIDPNHLKLSAPPQLTLHTGAEILFRSADNPESLRGPNLSGVLLDEASLMPKMVYDVAIGRLREAGEQGWLSACFTPKGKTHWTWEQFATGKPDTELFRAHTAANPFNPPGFAKRLFEQYGRTRWAEQEIAGEFVAVDGAEFDPAWFDGPGFWFRDWPGNVALKVLYLDPSKGKNAKNDAADFQAYCSAVLTTDGTIHLDCSVEKDSVVQMVARGIETCRRWGPVASWAVEDNGTMGFLWVEIERQMRATGMIAPVHLVTNTEPKPSRIRRLGTYLSRGQIRIRDTPGGRVLRGQLGDYPLVDHDDAADAAAGAVVRLEQLALGL